MIAFLKKVLIVAVLVYVILVAALFFMQRKFMYPVPGEHPRLASTSLTMMQEVEIKSSDGETVIAWWHPPEDGEAVVMFFHGNGSSVYDGRFIYQHLIEQGFGVLGAEYPGYPFASGSPSQDGIVNAAMAHYDFIREQGVAGSEVYLYGTSLGAGVSAQLASQREVGKIVLEAPFNSMMDMVRMRMPLFAIPPMIRDKYYSDEALQNVSVPILWIHGTADRVVPIGQGQKLFDGYQGPKESLIIKDGGHNNLWISGGREAVTTFLKR